MINKFNLHPAFHMLDFGEHGRFASKSEAERRAIFRRVVKIISAHNIHTIAVTVEHSQFRAIFKGIKARELSPYAVCFIGCIVGNHMVAEEHQYQKPIAYVVDTGNPYSDQIFDAHKSVSAIQDAGNFYNLGSLTFDSDENVTALQAADAVCWSVRRRAVGKSFNNGLEPLEEILNARGHNHSPVPETFMRMLLDRINNAQKKSDSKQNPTGEELPFCADLAKE